jgi:hypothetical protein
MQINNVYQADPIPTVIVRVIAYTFGINNVLTEVTRVDFPPPHINPRDISIYVPTPQVHLVRVYETPDTPSVGVLTIEYIATPSYSVPRITPPLEIIVGGGREERDPIIGSNGVDIPSILGIPTAWFEQRGLGPLSKQTIDSPDPTKTDWTDRSGGGIDLLNGKTFEEGEVYWLFFEPYLDSNVSAALYDLTVLIQNHIDRVDNPHSVTKNQIGLSNIPNAISDSISLNSPETLATSKAVNDLRLSIVDTIVGKGTANLGLIPGSSDQLKTVVHGYTLPYPYIVVGNLRGIGVNWNADNDSFAVLREYTDTSFKVSLRNVSGATATLFFDYILIKL